MPPVFQKSQPLLALHLALRPSPPSALRAHQQRKGDASTPLW